MYAIRLPATMAPVQHARDAHASTLLPRDTGFVSTSVHPALASAAVEAVQAERWEPGRVRGVAIEVPLRMTIDYILHPRGADFRR